LFLKLVIMEKELKVIAEWYAKETNKTVADFDEYDLHVCRVVEGYKKAQEWISVDTPLLN